MVKPMVMAKAFVAAIIAGLGALGTSLVDNHVDQAEWVAVALATVVALNAVFWVPNKDPEDK